MDWKGKINFNKAIELNGKPHGIESEPTLPTFENQRDFGRVVFAEDTGKVWAGGETQWSELTPGGIGEHYHDDRYYTETEVDDFFAGESEGKKQIDWTNILSPPSTYTPSEHGNESHSDTYVTSDDITYETLSSNGDVGTGSDQVARGDHNHDSIYAPIDLTSSSVSYDNTTSMLSAENVKAAIDELDSRIDYSENPIEGIFFVDNSRKGSYTPDGSIGRPFKSLTNAISHIESNHAGKGTIFLSASTYDESVTIGPSISVKSLGQSVITTGPVTIGDGSTSGSNNIENIEFRCPVEINTVDTVSLSGVSFSGDGTLTLTNGSAEGDPSFETTSTSAALILGEDAGTFFGDNCSFSSVGQNTIIQSGGELILSNSDMIGFTTDYVLKSTNGVTNLSNVRIINTESTGGSFSIENGASMNNPNIITSIYKRGTASTGTAVTIIDGIYGDSNGISGTSHVYRPSSRLAYNPSNSSLSSTTIQGALDEIVNSHSNFQQTSVVYVDSKRTDEYTPTGAIDKPFKNIEDALAIVESGDTIKAFNGSYSVSSGNIVLPDNVNLVGEGQGKTNFYNKVITGSGGKCRLEHISFRGGLEINNGTTVHYIYSNKSVELNGPIQGDGFSVEVNTGTALTINNGGAATLALNTISTTDDAPAIRMNSGAGQLILQAATVKNNSASQPAIKSDGGSVALLITNIVNDGSGLAADLRNDSTVNTPNMLTNVLHVGGIDCDGVPTIVEGVQGGDPVGDQIALRPATQIGFDPSESGLSSLTVQDSIDEISSMIGSGSSADITYSNTDSDLQATNVKDAIDELDSVKVDINHNHNDIYYTQPQLDTNFVRKSELADVTTHPASAAYQEIVLNGQSQTNNSGLTANETYDFNLEVDGSTSNLSITPEQATQGYQELGLDILETDDTSLAPDTYDFKVRQDGNALNTYTIVIDPATPASVEGDVNLTNGYNWSNDNADFSIDTGAQSTTIQLSGNNSTVNDVVDEINGEFSDAGINAIVEASAEGDSVRISTVDTGSSEEFTLTDGTNSALASLGISVGTYTGTDPVYASQDINLDNSILSTTDTQLQKGTLYSVDVEVDGSMQTVTVEFTSAASGYQELGYSGLTPTTETSLSNNSTFYLNINVDDQGDQEIGITVGDPSSGYQELGLTEVSLSDESGLVADTSYDFELNASTHSITTGSATSETSGYQIIDINGAFDSVGPSGLSPSTAAQVIGTNDMTGGYDWATTPQDLIINGTTISFIDEKTSLTQIVDELNSQFTTEELNLEALENGNNVEIKTTTIGSASEIDISSSDAATTLGLAVGTYNGTQVDYTLNLTIDGTNQDITITPLDDTTYGEVLNLLNAETTGATWSSESSNIKLTSDSTGSTSTVSISDDDSDFIDAINGGNSSILTAVDGTDSQSSTTWDDILSILNNETNSFTWSLEGDDIRVTNSSTSGPSSTVDLVAGSSNDFLSAVGASVKPPVNGTSGSTWQEIISLLNTETTGANWSLTGGDVRLESESTSNSSISISSGTTGDDLLSSLGIQEQIESPVNGTDSDSTTYEDLSNKLTNQTLGATWSIEDGNLRCTTETPGTSGSILISENTSNNTNLISSLSETTTPLFINDISGVDAEPATTNGSALVSGFDFSDKTETLIFSGQTISLDSNTTTFSEILTELDSKLPNGLESFDVDGGEKFVGIRTTESGSSESFDLDGGSARATFGFTTGTYSGTDKTDTTWINVLSLMNASTTANVDWTIEDGDVRCTSQTTGSSSTIELGVGDTNDLYDALGSTLSESAVNGSNATNRFSDIINHLNDVSTGVTWTWESGNIRITRDELGSSHSTSVTSGTQDVFTNLSGFESISTQTSGVDEDTFIGSDLIGIQGIEGVAPTGGNVGDNGTLQEVLEGSVGQINISQPDSPSPGRAWFDTDTNTLWIYNGTDWVSTQLS